MKFRVWCKNENSWESHGCFLDQHGNAYQYNGKDMFPLRQETHIVQFYTGLKDKNGKEIYEGDIVFERSWWWGPGYVVLNKGSVGPCNSPCVMSWVTSKNIDNPESDFCSNLWEFDKIEVIGNIYENPELLNKKRR
jgi:uncharacterized phage protein (TIGR01671 family)